MTDCQKHSPVLRQMVRRTLLGSAAAGVLAKGLGGRGAKAAIGGEDEIAHWTPDYVTGIASTTDVDTAAECAKVVPLKTKGKLTFWYVGPTHASPPLDKIMYDQFWEAFGKTYPNITVEQVSLDYNSILDKLRTAALGNAAPSVARLMLLWSPELAAKEMLHELRPEDVGHKTVDFWPGAMKSVSWDGKVYGVPTNNETMALIWNAQIFRDAGLDPEQPPATWDDLVSHARQIKQKTGKAGYGLVARANAGNTPYALCRTPGPVAEARWMRQRIIHNTRRSQSTTRERKRRCRHATTCMCATNQRRVLRSLTRRRRTRIRSSPAGSA
jgi:multiple sugar transport system substrate-binding protein